MTYSDESLALEDRILRTIATWHASGTILGDGEFNDLANDILAFQLRYNAPYAQFCAVRGITLETLPVSWEEIPAVPSAAFKEATLATFDPMEAQLTFETSGTTEGVAGKHYFERSALYDAALLATFDRLVLADGLPYHYLNLVPNPVDHPQSSLGYMMAELSRERGDGKTGWYVQGDTLNFRGFIADAEMAILQEQPLFITGTAFAFVQLCDLLVEKGRRILLPPRSRVMETGGFKGRSRIVERGELYAALADRFGISQDSVFSEYGMTELTSQYYDTNLHKYRNKTSPQTHAHPRVKTGPPWLRPRATGIDGRRAPPGVVGALAHIDLANLSSCIAIQTEDLGAEVDGGIILLGRDQGAELRGCSLDAETLRAQ